MRFAATDPILDAGPVIPVLALHDGLDLAPLAEALVAGGIQVFEVVLRTPSALSAIARLKGRVARLGAGTVLTREQMVAARDAGAEFCVSPGLTPDLHAAAVELSMPLLPGCATASEVMAAQALGYSNLKFFPAERAGGPEALGDFASVFPSLRFCPTGGISADNARVYLANRNVACVGGSLATPSALVQAKDWDGLRQHVESLINTLT